MTVPRRRENRRPSWLATVVFYGLNGISLDAPDEDAYDLVIAIASGATTQIEALAAALSTWHRVRQESESR